MKFENPSVRVDNSVWMWLAKEKLENLKLSKEPVLNKLGLRSEQQTSMSQLVVTAEGPVSEEFETVLINTNTAKEFREFDRKGIFDRYSEDLLKCPATPKLFLISFADLKTFVFTYNVALPSISPGGYDFECEELVTEKAISPSLAGPRNRSVCLSRTGEPSLIEFNPADVIDGDIILVHDKWSSGIPFYVRTILTSVALRIPRDSEIRVTLRIVSDLSNTEYRGIVIRSTEATRVVPNWIKWTNPISQQATAIMSVDLKRFMDPSTIAAESIALNIKLMKWRILPALEPEKMSNLRFLLIGAGTLGCAVARCLVSWGVSRITLVDSGRVSYSNPARQWLFTLQDATDNAPKAETAARRLREVYPSSEIKGVELSVPLPGHPADLSHVEQSYSQLEQLVNNHDVVFMLTDSRESRWLPSLLVQAAGEKRVMGVSVALGFDSYLIKVQPYDKSSNSSSCYFCNDVNAPTDQTSFRTLDQQCTVTRPGLAAIASCMAVELVASFSQAKNGFASQRTVSDESLLGSLPDQIRGFLGTFQSFPAVTEKFDHCICCSDQILNALRSGGLEFVKSVVANSETLMEISGLNDFNKRVAGGEDVIVFESDESE
jgi:ubiquitin-like modifier-activating enzyme ATG7